MGTRFGGLACATSAVERVSSSPQTNLVPQDGTVPSQPGIFRVSNDAATLADLARIMYPDTHPDAPSLLRGNDSGDMTGRQRSCRGLPCHPSWRRRPQGLGRCSAARGRSREGWSQPTSGIVSRASRGAALAPCCRTPSLFRMALPQWCTRTGTTAVTPYYLGFANSQIVLYR